MRIIAPFASASCLVLSAWGLAFGFFVPAPGPRAVRPTVTANPKPQTPNADYKKPGTRHQAPGTDKSPRPQAPGTKEFRLRTVVLDAGHGGKDRGCAGASAREADVALAIVRSLGRQIEDSMPGVRVIYTRKTDVFVQLAERAAIANRAQADLFISVHCNAGPAQSHGTEVWTMGLHKSSANLGVAQRENAVILQEDDYQSRYGGFDPQSPQSHILFSLFQSAYVTNSLRFAAHIDQQFRTHARRSSRGVKQAGFLVLWKSTMPAVLIESGFLTNAAEERYLNDKTNQTYMAASILRALREYKRELEGS